MYCDRLADDYEYYEDWRNRSSELEDISLDEYDYSCRIRDYGMTDDELGCGNGD